MRFILSVETVPQPFKYNGQYGVFSEPNGLYYMRARYYDPAIGRFISEDPSGFDGGDVNLYAYCDSVGKPSSVDCNLYNFVGNNPVNRIDPYGLWYIDINISMGWWGAVGTGGIMVGSTGIYTYAGGGIGTPGPGAALTWSSADPSPGWNAGVQGGYWIGGQGGIDSKKNQFSEVGLVTPGVSATAYYVQQFKGGQRCK